MSYRVHDIHGLKEVDEMTTVLYTGGTGRMGQVIRKGLAGRYDKVVLYTRGGPDEPLYPNETVVHGDLCDLERLSAAADGTDVIVHLGGIADEAPFDEIEHSNIRGTYNLYEAARNAEVRRVVYASSNHVVGFHPSSIKLDETAALRPDTYYGVSKAFGESLARLYYDKWGIESVCLRIGTFRPEPEDVRQLALWLSWPDGIELIRCAIEAPSLGYQVVYGCSANTGTWWDGTAGWNAIGFSPKDNAADYADRVGRDDEIPAFHGGGFTAADYRGGIW
ncbi:uronate dehydrogenase [Mycobacterium frederiksbergense]|uniref:Uronate dehydrogenase n=1 Tax=Mycolicibacterium frederiksbergense TaxID=117567 RepID=A0ABT6L1M2_9MYCO|nr:NAD(P)-dependent oxidoreductase [Mycolicibacterium frederiksbergense]MDH6196852.1 uronate dehydrogenase [Mycolicibacterium frederiksbergense]